MFLNALQQTFKIFINSFYGYLAFSQGHWNDFDVANQVTGEGRRLVQLLLDRLGGLGATVVEVDTDGIYFVPPVATAEAPADPTVLEEMLVTELSAALPEGIHPQDGKVLVYADTGEVVEDQPDLKAIQDDHAQRVEEEAKAAANPPGFESEDKAKK